VSPVPLTVGVDIGGTKCLALVLDGEGQILAEQRVATARGAQAVVDRLVAVIDDIRGSLAPGGHDVAAVGAGAPGLVDHRGVLRTAPNLPGVEELPLRSLLEERTGLPVQVDNDATCAAWGERQMGAAQGRDDVVVVTLGTGIGGGLVLGGRLYRGANGFAAEVGHMIVDPDGPACPCGGRGCWERYASGSGLARMAREAVASGKAARPLQLAGGDVAGLTGQHVTTAAAEGDADAVDLMHGFGWWVALGLANLANTFDPTMFVLGGGLGHVADLFIESTRDAFSHLVLAATHRPPVEIVPARLGELAGAIGAALIAREVVGSAR
jgi:glucokinase